MKNLIILILSSLLFTACSNSTSSENNDNEIDELITEVQNTTASFHDIDNAIEAGWSEDISECVEHPEEGGMGHHYARLEFFDGRTNHLEPQVMLYEPLENGGFEFIGVEYIVPFDVLPPNSEPPVLFGEEYRQNHEQEIWALHVWTEKENPSGLFADFNPNVSCQHAEPEGLETLRQATEQYSDIEAAMDDGFVDAGEGCVENPEGPGALGIPYVNEDRIDATIDLENPEVLFYEPQQNGDFQLIGVETVVPIELWEESDPPALFGQEFHRNDEAGLYGLHIWIWKDNPEGVLAFWHHDVSCQYAGE